MGQKLDAWLNGAPEQPAPEAVPAEGAAR